MDSLPVSALELGTLFPNSAQAEFGSFGLGRLERNGFLCAKAPLDPRTLFLFFAPAVWGFGLRRLTSQGFLYAKAANGTGGLCPYSALLNWDTFCLRLDFYGAGFDIGFKIIDKVLKVFGFLPSVPVSY